MTVRLSARRALPENSPGSRAGLHRTPVLMVLAVLLGAASAGAGCRKVELKDGFPCSGLGECPSPYRCAADGKC